MYKLLLSLLLSGVAMAQSSAVLVGLITTASGEPLRNAKIVLVSASGETHRETTTDELGIYAFSLLPAGEYRLEMPGRKPAQCPGTIQLRTDEKKSWRTIWDSPEK